MQHHPPEQARLALRVTALCRGALPSTGVDGAGVALVTRTGHRATVCATDDVAGRLEEAQFVLGEGPCVDASSGRTPVLLDDLLHLGPDTHARWPGFLHAAAEVRVRSVFAFPLRMGAVAFGALHLYRLVPGPLDDEQLRAALLLTDAVALLLLELSAGPDTLLGPVDGARTALRFQVHAAAGMAKVQLGRSIEHALIQLRAVAFAEERPIDDVARDVLDGRLRFSRETP